MPWVGNVIRFINGHCPFTLTMSWAYIGLRFVREIKIIFKYRGCLKVLRIVICKYKDLTREFYQKYSFRVKSHFENLFD